MKLDALIALLLALFVGGYVYLRHVEARGYEHGRADTQAKWHAATDKAIKDNAAKLAAQQAQKDKAINEAALREKSLRADAARARSERDGLRGDIAASRAAIATAPIDALRQRIAALSDVFDECTARYGALAQDADRHASDSLTLQQAWPK